MNVNKNITHDIDEAITWLEKRNKDIKTGNVEVKFETMPSLIKIILGGEESLKFLSKDEKEKYADYFKKNAARLSLLTIANPVVGMGTTGFEMAASGLVSTKTAVTVSTLSAGTIGLTTLAASSIPKSISVAAMKGMSWIPQVRMIGIGLFALGAGATIFKTIEKMPQGKRIIRIYDDAQEAFNSSYAQLDEIFNKMEDYIATKIKSSTEIAKEATKKIGIMIDDAIHSDQNKRIMQFQDIVYAQYEKHVEMEENLRELADAYKSLSVEKNKLIEKIRTMEVQMQMSLCLGEHAKGVKL